MQGQKTVLLGEHNVKPLIFKNGLFDVFLYQSNPNVDGPEGLKWTIFKVDGTQSDIRVKVDSLEPNWKVMSQSGGSFA